MNGKKDIDPQSELDEREDEPTLPEIDEEPDLMKTGTLAAGRSAIVLAAKHAPKGIIRGVWPQSMNQLI